MNPQLSAAPYDISIHSQREAAALGTYRIKLEHIKLPVIPDDRQRNVSRLKRIFQRQKILRLEPFNSITATIDATVFNRRAGRVDEHVTNLLGKPPELLLSLDEEVQCIHGKCRIKAADSILKGRDRWWTVSLYRTDIGIRHILL